MGSTSDQEREWCRETLTAVITPATIIHTRLEVGRGEADYVRVYVIAANHDGRLEVQDQSYRVACLIGAKMTQRGIRMGGGQYNKGLQVADALWRTLFSRSLDQGTNWKEIS